MKRGLVALSENKDGASKYEKIKEKYVCEIVVEKGHYFIMGDNRDNSRDSRECGQIPRNKIYGKVYLIVRMQKGETFLSNFWNQKILGKPQAAA